MLFRSSTSEAYSAVFRLIANPDSVLLAPRPGYPLLDYLAGLHDLHLEPYPLRYEGDWKIDSGELQKKIERGPSALLLVHPHHPTGNFVSESERSEILKLCAAGPLPLLCDEVFLDYPLETGGGPASFASEKNAFCFTLSGLSKILGLPQMKLSWIVLNGPEELRQEAARRLEVILDTYLSVATPVQHALPDWRRLQKEIQNEIRQRLLKNFESLKERLAKTENLRLLRPQGGWVAVLEILCEENEEGCATALLEKDHVMVYPGYFFDFEEGRHLILSLLPPPAVFEEGLDRLCRRFVKGAWPC